MSINGVKQIGIVGGGASSLMLCIEAAKLGIRTCLLDPQVDCVGSRVASEHYVASITSENIKKLSLRSDYIIYNTRPDFEINVKLHSNIYPIKENLNEIYNFKNILDMVELLEIPTAKIVYQKNDQDAFKELDGLTMPFRFIKQYKGYSKQMDIFSKESLTDFIMDSEEDAESFMLQPISEYKQIAACICIADASGKIYQYHPIEESTDEADVCHLKIGETFSKSMVSRLARYNRKLLKEFNAVGVYTIKYGIKANKSVEFIEISSELGIGSLLTLEAYETSVYEQYMRLVLGMKLSAPELISFAHGTVKGIDTKIEQDDERHIYHCGIANFCMQRER